MFQTHMLSKLCRAFFGIVIGLASLSPAWAASTEPWTTAGSAGTVAPANLPFVQFGNPIPAIVGDTRDVGAITLQPFAFGTFDIRYNVVSVPGILGSPGITLTVRYLASNSPSGSLSLSSNTACWREQPPFWVHSTAIHFLHQAISRCKMSRSAFP